MKPALDEFFENYGKKKGVELLNLFFKEVEDEQYIKTILRINNG